MSCASSASSAHTTLAIVAAAIAILLGPLRPDLGHAAAGDLDGSFGTGGVFVGPPTAQSIDDTHGLALDHLGRSVVAFRSDEAHTNTDLKIGVLRLTTGGVLDPTFNPTGPTPGVLITGFGLVGCADGTANGPLFQSVAVTPDHHIVIVADLCLANAGNIVGIMRLDDTGAFDDGFDGDGKLVLINYPSYVKDVAVDASERIYIAGGHCLGGGPADCQSHNAFITRFTKQGTRDQSFNAGGTTAGIFEVVFPSAQTSFNAMKVLAGDHIVAVGTVVGDTFFDALVARISGDGQFETGFGAGSAKPGTVRTDLGKPLSTPQHITQAEAWGVTTTDDDQSVVVTGQVTANEATCPVAKFTATGALDTTFASNQSTPGIASVPSAGRCRHLLTEPNGKIVAIGFGPRPLSGNNQFVLGRFGSDGQLDPSFGVGGITGTPVGDRAEAEDGALQSDGKILVIGIRQVVGDFNPVVLRYQNGIPGPTPTATPIDQPGEVCGNCIDDEGDGYLERDDPECGTRADGGGQGLGTPKVEGKAVVKCAKAVATAGTKLGAARLTHLQRCTQAVFGCVQLKATDPKCLPKATTTCGKQLAATTQDRIKMSDAITKACAVPALPFDDLASDAGLGFGADGQACAAVGVATLTSLADVIDCMRARQECAAEQLLALEVPRAAELLTAGGVSPGPCLPPAGVLGAGLADEVRAKAALKCQATVLKATTKFASTEQKGLLACVQAATSCVQLKRADPDCLAKLRTTCAKKIVALTTPGGIETKLSNAITKGCGGLDPTELTGTNGLGYEERYTDCIALNVTLDSAAGIVECLRQQHECRVAQMLDATTPRLKELLGLGQVTLP